MGTAAQPGRQHARGMRVATVPCRWPDRGRRSRCRSGRGAGRPPTRPGGACRRSAFCQCSRPDSGARQTRLSTPGWTMKEAVAGHQRRLRDSARASADRLRAESTTAAGPSAGCPPGRSRGRCRRPWRESRPPGPSAGSRRWSSNDARTLANVPFGEQRAVGTVVDQHGQHPLASRGLLLADGEHLVLDHQRVGNVVQLAGDVIGRSSEPCR